MPTSDATHASPQTPVEPTTAPEPARHGVVVFVDEGRWVAFDQMAAVLRRQGLQVVRLTTDATRPARLVDALIYDESTSYTTHDDLSGLLARWDRPELLDVVAVDDLVPLVARMPMQHMPAAVAHRLRDRLGWVDKLQASDRLEAAGIPVPDIRRAHEVDAAEAAREFGLPLVVKDRIGAGGAGVRIVHSVEDARAAVRELSDDAADVFFQRFASGRQWSYGAAVVDGTVREDAAYETFAHPHRPHGPSTELVVVDEPRVLAAGRAAVEAMHADGLVSLDLVDDDGTVRVIDVNYRVWNAAVLLRGAGVRLDEGYLEALLPDRTSQARRGTARPARTARPGSSLTVFPAAIHHDIVTDGTLDARRIVQQARPFIVWAGPRYVAASVLQLLDVWSYERGIGIDTVRSGVRNRLGNLRRR